MRRDFLFFFIDFASLTSSMYLNVKLGIEDKSVFDVPIDCMLEEFDIPMEPQPQASVL